MLQFWGGASTGEWDTPILMGTQGISAGFLGRFGGSIFWGDTSIWSYAKNGGGMLGSCGCSWGSLWVLFSRGEKMLQCGGQMPVVLGILGCFRAWGTQAPFALCWDMLLGCSPHGRSWLPAAAPGPLQGPAVPLGAPAAPAPPPALGRSAGRASAAHLLGNSPGNHPGNWQPSRHPLNNHPITSATSTATSTATAPAPHQQHLPSPRQPPYNPAIAPAISPALRQEYFPSPQ